MLSRHLHLRSSLWFFTLYFLTGSHTKSNDFSGLFQQGILFSFMAMCFRVSSDHLVASFFLATAGKLPNFPFCHCPEYNVCSHGNDLLYGCSQQRSRLTFLALIFMCEPHSLQISIFWALLTGNHTNISDSVLQGVWHSLVMTYFQWAFRDAGFPLWLCHSWVINSHGILMLCMSSSREAVSTFWLWHLLSKCCFINADLPLAVSGQCPLN